MKTTSIILAGLTALAWGSAMPEELNGRLVARQAWADSDMLMVQLVGGEKRYISYGALKSDGIPCSRRGNSFTNCKPGAQANAYSRGCSAINRCRTVNES